MGAFADKMTEYMLDRHWNQQEFADFLGVTRQDINGWLKGKHTPYINRLEYYADKMGVSVNWLLGKEINATIKVPAAESTASGIAPKIKSTIRVPVLGRVPAGVPIEAIQDIIDWEDLDQLDYPSAHEYFGLLVVGDSMYPKYQDGDTIIVEKADDADSSKDVIAIVNGNDATLKRLVKYENGNIELKPVNPDYQSQLFTPEDIEKKPVQILGYVKELRRKV